MSSIFRKGCPDQSIRRPGPTNVGSKSEAGRILSFAVSSCDSQSDASCSAMSVERSTDKSSSASVCHTPQAHLVLFPGSQLNQEASIGQPIQSDLRIPGSDRLRRGGIRRTTSRRYGANRYRDHAVAAASQSRRRSLPLSAWWSDVSRRQSSRRLSPGWGRVSALAWHWAHSRPGGW